MPSTPGSTSWLFAPLLLWQPIKDPEQADIMMSAIDLVVCIALTPPKGNMSNICTSPKAPSVPNKARSFQRYMSAYMRATAPNPSLGGGRAPRLHRLLWGLGTALLATFAVASSARADTLSDLEAPLRHALQ